MPEPLIQGEEEQSEEPTEVEDGPEEEVVDDVENEGGESGEVDGEPEDEEVETEEVDMPGEEENVDEDDEAKSLLNGSTLGINNKILIGAGIAAIIVVLILRNWEVESTTQDYDQEQVENEIDEQAGETANRGSLDAPSETRYDEETQDAAISEVFG